MAGVIRYVRCVLFTEVAQASTSAWSPPVVASAITAGATLIALIVTQWVSISNQKANDRRALKAEDRRHTLALEADRRTRIATERLGVYVELEALRLELYEAVKRVINFRDFSEPVEVSDSVEPSGFIKTSEHSAGLDIARREHQESVKTLGTALKRFREVTPRASLLASRDINKKVREASVAAWRLGSKPADADYDAHLLEMADDALNALGDAMRREVGADEPTVDEVAPATSA